MKRTLTLLLVISCNFLNGQQNPQEQYDRAIQAMYAEDFSKAVEEFSKYLLLVPKDSAAWFDRGMAYTLLGDFDAAEKDFSRQINIDGGHTDSYFLRGEARVNLRKSKKAAKDFQMVVKLEPKNADAHYHLGLIYAEQQKYEAAIVKYSDALALDDQIAKYFLARAEIYRLLGQIEKANSDIETARNLP